MFLSVLSIYIPIFFFRKSFAFMTSRIDTTSKTVFFETSSVQRNEHFAKLESGYLFPEIAKRKAEYLKSNQGAQLISLGIGDTTLPIPKHILSGLVLGVRKLGSTDGYTGYGAEQGMPELREKIAKKLYKNLVKADEVFVSDGAKCDIARLQLMFGSNVVMAVQDPSYPVYVDTSVMIGQTSGVKSDRKQYGNVVYLSCNPGNGFFPDIAQYPRADVYYICSPNNPTGAVATRSDLEQLVDCCHRYGSFLVFDAAYAPFIRTPGISYRQTLHLYCLILLIKNQQQEFRSQFTRSPEQEK